MKAWLLALLLLLCAGLPAAVLAADETTPAAGATTGELAQPVALAEAQQVLVLLRLPHAHFRADGNYAGSGYGDGAGRSARRRVAEQLAREHGLQLTTDWPMPALGLDCYVMRLPATRQPEQVADTLSHDKRVEWAQPMHIYRAQQQHQQQGSAVADPLYPVQPTARAWRLAELHQIATGRNVRVAVIDSGTERDHPDLAGQVVQHQDFVGPTGQAGGNEPAENHGTAVAGLVAARGGNGLGIVGVAPQARLMALRACRQVQAAPEVTSCTSFGLAKALYFALGNDAGVINLSLAGPHDRLLAQLIDLALQRGITVVAAYDRSLPAGGFPASHAGVVAVAADDGPALAAGPLYAPARDLPTTGPGGRWRFVSGASYAAAQVSGLFALLRELNNNTSGGARASAALVRAADGGIDTCATLLRAHPGPCACSCSQAQATLPLAAQR